MKGQIKLISLAEAGIVPEEKMKIILKRREYIEAGLDLNKIKKEPCDYKYWLGVEGVSADWTNNADELMTMVIEYPNENWDEYSTLKSRYLQMPIVDDQHKKIINKNLIDKVMSFEIIEVYVEPPGDIHPNRGSYKNKAKIDFDSPWDDIWEEFKKTDNYKFSTTKDVFSQYIEYLKENFKSPKRKK